LAWLAEAVAVASLMCVTIEDFANQHVAYDLAYELSQRAHPVGSALCRTRPQPAAILKRSLAYTQIADGRYCI
jgi:hypothetical protein